MHRGQTQYSYNAIIVLLSLAKLFQYELQNGVHVRNCLMLSSPSSTFTAPPARTPLPLPNAPQQGCRVIDC